MAGFYIRRGEKVIGPFQPEHLKQFAADGNLQPTDDLAQDLSGPWRQAGQSKSLPFRAVPAVVPPQPLTVVQPTDPIESQGPVYAILRGGKVVFATVGRGMLTASGATMRGLGKWAERRHEIKLAKIRANAERDIAEAQRPIERPQSAAAPQASSPIPVMPQIVQTTVVKIVNRNEMRTGCSGCGCLLVLLLIIVGLIILANQQASHH